MTVQTSRRSFLKGAAAVGAVMVVGLRPDGAFAAGHAAAEINPFVRVLPDGVVQVVLKHFEMGQGTTTGLATLVAEELDADWARVTVDFAPADSARYKNFAFGTQGTGGSTAIANSFMQYRKAAAAAREVLVAAAADAWGVPASSIAIEKGVLKSGNRSAHFGEMVDKAMTLTPSADPEVKQPAQFRLIGLDGLPRQDTPGKTDGSAEFALDVKVPGMVTAMLVRSPRFGGKLASFRVSRAAKVPGFIDAKALPSGSAVAARPPGEVSASGIDALRQAADNRHKQNSNTQNGRFKVGDSW